MKEIEILVEVFEDKKLALTKLEKFNFKGLKDTNDIYYFDPQRKNLQVDKDGKLKECLRLRNKDNKYFLTHKKDHFDEGGIWLYSDEYEVGVSDFNIIDQIINNLGFEKLVEVKSHKNYFIHDNYEIVLEEVENLGLFLEVELINSENITDIKQAKAAIWQFIESFGLKISDELLVGKPELMLRKISNSHVKNY